MEIDINKMMERFTVHQSPTLFDLERDEFFKVLKENRCIYCGNKLVFMRNGKMAYCKSVKHKKRFIISLDKLNKLNGN